MNKLLEKLTALVNVKTMVTLAVMGVFVRLALGGQIEPQAVMQIVTMVVAFYFGTQHEKKNGSSS